MITTKCPRCGKVYFFKSCSNCGSVESGFFSPIAIGKSTRGNLGVYCKKCKHGIYGMECECGCSIHGDLFKDDSFFHAIADSEEISF